MRGPRTLPRVPRRLSTGRVELGAVFLLVAGCATRARVAGPRPASQGGQGTAPDGTSLTHEGKALLGAGKPAAALAAFQRALEVDAAPALRQDDLRVAARLNNVGAAMVALGSPAEALVYFRRSFAIDEMVLDKAHPDLAIRLNNIGVALHALGRPSEALAYYRWALAVDEEAPGTAHPDVAIRLGNIAVALQSLGKSGEAVAYFQRARAIAHRTLVVTGLDSVKAPAKLTRTWIDR